MSYQDVRGWYEEQDDDAPTFPCRQCCRDLADLLPVRIETFDVIDGIDELPADPKGGLESGVKYKEYWETMEVPVWVCPDCGAENTDHP